MPIRQYITARFGSSSPVIWLGRLIVFGGLAVLLLAMFFVSEGAGDPPPLQRSQYDAHLLVVDRDALEAAYRHQVELLFATWMRDETGQPDRALNGIRKAAHAYIAALDGANQREQELMRNPYAPK
jgi:hypothetical protein